MKLYNHNLSYEKKLTCDMGELVPIGIQEVLPGDIMKHQTSVLIRVTPLLAPILHQVDVRISHFFVPYSQIWNDDGGAETDWIAFVTGGKDGTATPTHPYHDLNAVTVAEGDLFDYLGIPPANYTGSGLTINALFTRAYAHIYNHYYRDQDLVTELTIDTTDGADSTTDTDVQNIAWQKDEFTAARPWEQRGTEVEIPLGGSAKVTGIGVVGVAGTGNVANIRETGDTGLITYTDGWAAATAADVYVEEEGTTNYPNIYADLSTATGVPISALRESIGLQRYMELMARSGARYQEYLQAQWDVRGDDLRMQVPLLLASGRNSINFSEVVATAETGTTVDVGDLKGHGIAAVRSNNYIRRFKEHGVVMTLLSVRPKAVYANAIARHMFRNAKEDYYVPQLALIGDQAITNKEVYSEHSTPDGVFGYSPRYNEYRHNTNSIHGGFHSTYAHWHLARIFTGDVALNQSFIECNPSKRILAEQTGDALLVQVYHNCLAKRPVLSFAKPQIL